MKIINTRAEKMRGLDGVYYSVRAEIMLGNGAQFPIHLKMPLSEYTQLTSALNGEYDGPQDTSKHLYAFEQMSKALNGVYLAEITCDHVVDNQGICHRCGAPANTF